MNSSIYRAISPRTFRTFGSLICARSIGSASRRPACPAPCTSTRRPTRIMDACTCSVASSTMTRRCAVATTCTRCGWRCPSWARCAGTRSPTTMTIWTCTTERRYWEPGYPIVSRIGYRRSAGGAWTWASPTRPCLSHCTRTQSVPAPQRNRPAPPLPRK